jgi:predicted nucleic acid-binding Zn ribbon protein
MDDKSNKQTEQQEQWDLAQIRQRRSRLHAKPIGTVMRRLMASSGYGETQAALQISEVWREAVGSSLADVSRPGTVSRGVLLVYAANSAVMQELHFRKADVIRAIQSRLSTSAIRDLRIRVGDC